MIKQKTPFPFQEMGSEFLKSGRKRILADDMGLGKTLQSINAAELPCVVIAPTGPIRNNWEDEIRSVYPDAKIVKIVDNNFVKNMQAIEPGADFYLLNYEKIRHDALRYLIEEKLEIRTVILDEAHRLRNHNTKLFNAFKKFLKGIPRIYFLTGTPLVNKPDELWSYLHLINPAAYKSYVDFVRTLFYTKSNGWTEKVVGIKNPQLLKSITDLYILRRLKEEVFDLAKPRTIQHRVKLENFQLEVYKQMMLECYTEAFDKYTSATNILSQMVRLKQLSISPQLLDGMNTENLEGSKVEAVQDIIDSTDAKIIFFSQFGEVVKRIPKDPDPKKWAMFTGKYGDREEAINRFKTDPECKVLYMTYAAGGEGINLQEAEYVILMDLPWTGKDVAQAISRAHRLGQTKLVTVYSIEAEDTIDQWIGDLLLDKLNAIEMVISGDVAFQVIRECKARLEDLVYTS